MAGPVLTDSTGDTLKNDSSSDMVVTIPAGGRLGAGGRAASLLPTSEPLTNYL